MKEFRKLDIELPQRPLINQRPFMVAGFIFAFIILLLIAVVFLTHR